ncbi:MAG TPA: hypothetical protein VK217_05970 [Acidimicrobiales bacterium]|nr:hypothetical protein [Acidimicrobiales bacterium]
MSARSSKFGGTIACGSVTSSQIYVGECFWQSPDVAVIVATSSSNLTSVDELTTRVVTELHAQTG